MEKNALNAGLLPRLEQVNLNARARRTAEGQLKRAAAIVEMLMGKDRHGSAVAARSSH